MLHYYLCHKNSSKRNICVYLWHVRISLLKWLQDIDFVRMILGKGVFTHFTNIIRGYVFHYESWYEQDSVVRGLIAHSHTHTYIYLYLYMCVCMYICIVAVFFFCSQFFTAVIYTSIYIHIFHFHLHHSVNIYSTWLQEQFYNLSLYTVYMRRAVA
jgi:hypothetical protein